MAQHAYAMRHILRSLLQKIVGGYGIGADDFVGRDANAKVVVSRFAAEGSDDHVFRQQAGTTAFG